MKKSSSGSKADSNVVDGLSHLLADTYLLYLKTQNFHWNVTGQQFLSLHQLFETQYVQLSAAVDLLAERIRALNAPAPGSFSEFLKMTSLDEASDESNAEQMVKALLKDHASISTSINGIIHAAEEDSDEVTLDMLIDRKTEHDKNIWMLSSTLGK